MDHAFGTVVIKLLSKCESLRLTALFSPIFNFK